MNISGLTTHKASLLLAELGSNKLDQKKPVSAPVLFLSQFTSPLILILLLSAIVTAFIGDFADALIILIAVVLNSTLGFFQEFKAQNALESLSQVISIQASVFRDGKLITIPVSQVVPGDVCLIEAGSQIPADGILLEERELLVNEAILTGESVPLKKTVSQVLLKEIKMPQPQEPAAGHAVYMGTSCIEGKAKVLVVSTGTQTQVGQIAKQLSDTHEQATPLQAQLSAFSQKLTVIILLLGLMVFVFGVSVGTSWQEMMKLAVAIAVSAIPEGLAISLTVILAIGMQRMLKKNALVRKLVAAETLGSITVICTDKTGTLTEGVLSVFKAKTAFEAKMVSAGLLLSSPTDPLEKAIRSWAQKKKGEQNEELLLDELPFSSQVKYSVKLTQKHVFLIGAPEVVLKNTTSGEPKNLEEEMLIFARKGYRLVAVSVKHKTDSLKKITKSSLSDFEWLGYFVLSDTVRKSVKPAFEKLKQAHIQMKVITGDHALTARAVMEEIGIKIKDDEIMLGHEFQSLSLSQLTARIRKTRLFARTTPDQKLIIVKALQADGEVVAMTGDGVNDAPALKQADIGIVVSSASDVSKQTADIVLLDDHFPTIISAVEEGRGMFENLRKILLYLLANAFCETVVVVIALLMGLPVPITAIQVLWINLATDSLPAMALTIDPKPSGLLKQRPRKRNIQLLDGQLRILMTGIAIISIVIVMGVYVMVLPELGLLKARTLVFTMFGVMTLVYVFSTRTLNGSVLNKELFSNPFLIGSVLIGFLLQLSVIYVPFLQQIFETVPLAISDWTIITFGVTILMFLIEGMKFLFRKYQAATLQV